MVKKFLLGEKEESSMVSTWVDYLYCSILRDGRLSLRCNVKDEYGSQWLPTITNIKTPKQFIKAFNSIERLEHWTLEEILPALHTHHPTFAIRLEQDAKYDELDEETETKIWSIVNPFIKNIELNLPSGNTNKRVFVNEVRMFVRNFLEKNGDFPQGKCSVYGRSINFPKKSIRIIK